MEVNLSEGSSLITLTQELGISDINSLFFVINGVNVEREHPLKANDKVDLIPAISGGER
jgi:molybdopterin converting factor small subunit